jgi:regulation of enolase protein 1 (concanavalin A-like superfamily)
VHDDAHGLLAPYGARDAVEVGFRLDYTEQFDQAGVLLRASATEWVKAGVEVSDGVPQVGCVVTHGTSDWSVAPVPQWVGRVVTVRASRDGDAVTIRARVDDEDFRLVRVAHVDPSLQLRAGPYCCAPTRAGLTVAFTSWRRTAADAALH